MASFNCKKRSAVFLGNIAYNATEQQMIEICEEIGPVVSFRFVMDKKTGKKKGYGFCTYLDEETALSACRNLQGCLVRGRQLRVNLAQDGKCTDITTNQDQRGSWVGSNLGIAQQPSGTTPAVPVACQPLGLSSASAAVSAAMGAIGGTQSGMENLQGCQQRWVSITNYLARMPACQLLEILLDIKGRHGSWVGPNLGAAQHPSGATPVDPAVSQSLGLSSASAAVLATGGALEGIQSGLAHQKTPDPSTIYLASLSKCQLQNISSEIKLLAADGMWRELLKQNPNILRAALLAEVMLEVATHAMECPSIPLVHVPVLQSQVPITPGMPFHAPTSTDASQFSYSRRVSAAAATPIDLPTEVKAWSELQPTKIRKLA